MKFLYNAGKFSKEYYDDVKKLKDDLKTAYNSVVQVIRKHHNNLAYSEGKIETLQHKFMDNFFNLISELEKISK